MLYKRFTFYLASSSDLYINFFDNVKNRFYTQWFTPTKLIMFYHLVLGVSLNRRVFRLVFSLPVNGQKTWSTVKSLKKHTNSVLYWKLNFFTKIFKKSNIILFLSEYLNLVYQAFWRVDWLFNKNLLNRLISFNKLKRFIDVSSLSQLQVLNFYKPLIFLKKTKKKNKNIKKRRNIGFKFGFTKFYRKHLI
jgi:hypothetical protein